MDAASRYDRTAAPLTRVCDSLSADDWSKPSPCEGWSAADVVAHLIDTQRDFLIRQGADLPMEAPSLETEGPALAWRIHAETVARQLIDLRIGEKQFDGAFGPTTVADTMDAFYGFDMVVHRWDVARAAGQDTAFTDDELDRLERDVEAWGEQLYSDGVCRPALPVADDASRQEKILARLGRS